MHRGDSIELERAEELDEPFFYEDFDYTPSRIGRTRSILLRNAAYFTSLALVAGLTFYFGAFSTLHVYLVAVCFLFPWMFVSDALKWWNRDLHFTKLQTARTTFLSTMLMFVLACSMSAVRTQPRVEAPNGVYFIASNLYNSEAILPKYTDALLTAIDKIGRRRVFVSIYENNSKDRTPELLRILDEKLKANGVARRIVHEDLPSSFYQQGRIERLSKLRNKVLEPLYAEARNGLNGSSFEKVVFLNDILYTPETLLKLLRTENGEYDQACAIDYFWLGIYDTWIVRDRNAKKVRPLWPYFALREDKRTVRQRGIVPVNSCWNGMTAFDARWFLTMANDTNTVQHSDASDENQPAIARIPLPFKPHDDHFDTPATLPLHFRSSRDCYESECLLSSLDMHRIAKPIRPRIFINSDLVVAYEYQDFFMYDNLLRWTLVKPWHVFWEFFVADGIFSTVGDIGRRPYTCAKYHEKLWVPP